MGKVLVIGGGPAGMIAAAEAAKNNHETWLLEKNEKLGKKLYITGKGRCNLTNNCGEEEFLNNVPGNPYFLYSAIYSFNQLALMDYIEALGVKLKTERGNRVFPVSDKASDVIKALDRNLVKNNVKVRLNTTAVSVLTENGRVKGVAASDGNTFLCDKVIIATGGLSYPVTGSTGDGYRFATDCGHNVTKLYPSLVAMHVADKFIPDLAGLSLKNINLSIFEGRIKRFTGFGEMLFTHTGISGPLVLTASRYLKGKDYGGRDISAVIDLKPAIHDKELDARILKDFQQYANKDFKNALDDLLPQKLIPVVVQLSGIEPGKKVHDITKQERKALFDCLRKFTLSIKGLAGYNEAVVTTGGVDVAQIDPGTMESKIIKGLHFAGEVIDVDGYTGGFNLQIAFSTGYLAGISV